MDDLIERRYLLMKRDLYYAPDNKGYTGIKDKAGRYLESDASPRNGVTAIHEDEAPDFSPACWDDLKVAHLQDRIAALEADNARLREALEQFLSLIEYQYCGSREAMNALQEADNSARAALEPMSKENAETFARSGNV